MRALWLIISLAFLITSCSEEKECKVCPENYVLVDGECKCAGLMLMGECRDLEEIYKYNGYISDHGVCMDSVLGRPTLITINFNGGETNRHASISFHKPDQFWTLSLYVYGSDSAYYIPGANRGFHDSFNNRGEEFDFYTREIDGETQYLRAYLKKLHDKYFRVHFTWETRWGTERERCTRIFHQ